MSASHVAATDRVVARIQATYRRWGRDTSVQQMRADWDALFPQPVEARMQAVTANGVPCEWVVAPAARDERVVVYFHGGGFQLGSLASHRELMAWISAETQAQVLGVGYRLAPEHPYPAALEDALSVWAWLQSPSRLPVALAVAGDSAGGGLGLSLLLALQREGGVLPAAYWGMSAWTDLTASGDSYRTHAELDPLNQRPMILSMARRYLSGGTDPQSPWVSPLFAPPDQLGMLPPLLLQVGERETVLSDSEVFARKAQAAGAEVELQVWPGMFHVFQQFPQELSEARDALVAGGRFLAAHLQAASTRKTQS
jgi:acetyl esterase/lipase